MSHIDPDAATDAVAFLVKLAGGLLDKIAAIKLMYFADRRAVLDTGHSITRAASFSYPLGLAGGEVLDLIDGRAQSDTSMRFLWVRGCIKEAAAQAIFGGFVKVLNRGAWQ